MVIILSAEIWTLESRVADHINIVFDVIIHSSLYTASENT